MKQPFTIGLFQNNLNAKVYSSVNKNQEVKILSVNGPSQTNPIVGYFPSEELLRAFSQIGLLIEVEPETIWVNKYKDGIYITLIAYDNEKDANIAGQTNLIGTFKYIQAEKPPQPMKLKLTVTKKILK